MIPEDYARPSVREVILGWEKLRITFNLLQLAIGLLLSWDMAADFGGVHVYVFWVIIYGVTANAFYCLGPLAEIYLLTLAPSRLPRTRLPAFIAGTAFSLIVTVALAFGTAINFAFRVR